MAKNRKLGRPSDHRMAMLRAMVTFLLETAGLRPRLHVQKRLHR